jgi:hypothetical protein
MQISLAKPAESTQYKAYKHLPRLNNELSKNCSTVEPGGFFSTGEFERACDFLNNDLELYPNSDLAAYMYTTYWDRDYAVKKAIRVILANESVETKWANYDKVNEVAEKLHNERVEQNEAMQAKLKEKAAQERLVKF